MNAKKTLALALAGAAAITAAPLASAQPAGVVVSLTPSTQDILLGGSTSVTANISGLTDFTPPALISFVFSIVYDSAVLTATGVTFGTGLEVSGGFAPILDYDLTTDGVAIVLELSNDDINALIAEQPDTFPLFTIDFDGVGVGTSLLDDDGNGSLSDENAEAIPFYFSNASITVLDENQPPGGEVPETSTTVSMLALAGLMGRYAWRRSKTQRA